MPMNGFSHSDMALAVILSVRQRFGVFSNIEKDETEFQNF